MRLICTPVLLLAVCASGCAERSRPKTSGAVSIEAPAPPGWRDTATPADAEWIDHLATEWGRAVASVPVRLRAKLSAEGPLLKPDAALDAPVLTPGSYHCRLIRLGGRRGVISYKPDFCYIANSDRKWSFTKQTGENLPGGWLFEDGDKRLVFLGTRRPAHADVAPPYGEEPSRDVAGVIERVAPFRWRMVLPRPGTAGELDIYELTPAVSAGAGGLAR